MDLVSELTANTLNCVGNCIVLLENDTQSLEIVAVRLESALIAIREVHSIQFVQWAEEVQAILDSAIQVLLESLDGVAIVASHVGRPRMQLSMSLIEYLISMKFTAMDVAKILGVSRSTVFGRMREAGIKVSQTYSTITDIELDQHILQVLTRFPNTGYKRMKGFLFDLGIKVTDQRIRTAMREVDPEGVYFRTMQNRCIVRRQYFVQYFNQLWHLDTNMKLIRWNIVIRSCIDGKARLVTYLDASSDNTAESNLASFMKAVATYGIPYRTRSDKGGENVLIARFMIEQRGENRASHICGKSVHNQRIERYWRDVFYGCTGVFYNVLSALEEDGYLEVDNPKHIALVHHVFLPRLNLSLEVFRSAWNQHPLSTERNYSPQQLMIANLPPIHYDLELGHTDLLDAQFLCNRIEDLAQLSADVDDTITTPTPAIGLCREELECISSVDVLRESSEMGYDIYVECLTCLIN